MKFQNLLLILLFTCTLLSCKRELQQSSWDVDLIAPIAKSSLNIENLLHDTLTLADENDFISIVFEQEFYELGMSDFLNMPDTNYSFSAYLDSLKLNPLEVSQQLTLGDILVETGLAVFITNGSNFAIPPLNGLSSDDIEIDASEYFTTMTLSQGLLDIRINNNLPIPISDLVFEIINANDMSMVSRDTFPSIPSGSEIVKTVDLAGKTINGNLIANIVNMSTPGTGGQVVTIDYSDALVTSFKVYNIKPYSATAIFPAQDLVNKGDVIYFNISEIALNSISVRSGVLTVEGYNTVEDPVEFMYKLPGLVQQADTFVVAGVIEAGSTEEASILIMEHDVSGYELNLQGPGYVERWYGRDLNDNGIIDEDTINTVFVLARASIDSTGNLIALSLQDSFIFRSALRDLIPEYATGFLGKDTILASGSTELDFPEIFANANIQLEQTILRLSVSNQLGMQAAVSVNSLKASNTRTGNSSTLQTQQTPLIYIDKPIDPYSIYESVVPVRNYFDIDHTNSNITELTSLSPNLIEYDIAVYLNHDVTPPPLGAGTDFIYESSRLKASLELEIPLSLMASNFMLEDTVPLDLEAYDFEAIQGGTIYLIADNSFPLEANLELFLLDTIDSNSQILQLINPSIQAGIIDGNNSSPRRSIINIPINSEILDQLRNAHSLRIKSVFNTKPVDTFVRIYSHQKLEITLTAEFNYQLND